MTTFKLIALIVSFIFLLIGVYKGIIKENYNKGTFFIVLSIIECLYFLVLSTITT